MWHHDLLGALGGHRAPLRPVSPSEQPASSRETEPTPAAPARASPAGAARSPPSSSGRSSVRAAATPRPWPPPPTPAPRTAPAAGLCWMPLGAPQ